ncbi:MAG: histidine kinase [Flavobacteriales bacterium]|nr:histidine kinase [Flavobacteriales bacterium]
MNLCVCAQDLIYHRYSTQDGLVGNIVYDVFQDSKGYMWFGTATGVSRYDGFSFHNYTVHNGLEENEVLKLCEDSKGRVWVLAYGQDVCHILPDSVSTGRDNPLLAQLSFRSFPCAYLIDDEKVWVGGNVGEVFAINSQDSIEVTANLGSGIRAFHKEADGEIWAVTSDIYYSLTSKDTVLSRGDLGSFLKAGEGPGGSLAKVHQKGIYLFQEHEETIAYESNSLGFINVNAVSTDRSNNLWIGTSKGVLKFAFDGHALRLEGHFLKDYEIADFFEDREGNYWVATLSSGILFIPNVNIFTYSNGDFSEATSVAVDQSGRVWACSENNSCLIIDKGTIDTIALRETWEASRQRVIGILPHSEGSVWIYGDGGAFRYKDGQTEVVLKYLAKSIFEGRYGKLWISTAKGLLWLEPWERNLEYPGKVRQRIVADQRIHAMCFDADSNILLGSLTGLMVFDGEHTKLSPYPEPFYNKRMTSLKFDNDTLWAGSYGYGLGIHSGGTFKQLTTSEGLAGNIIRSIYLGENGSAWVATNTGLSHVISQMDGSWLITNYTSFDGLASNDVNDVVAHRDSVWVATSSGLNVFPVKGLKKKLTTPLIHITGMRINRRDSAFTTELNLSYKMNHISFSFTGLSFKSKGDVTYRYRLGGLDSSWHTTEAAVVEYNALPHGDYNFMVYAIASDQTASREPASVCFSIGKPPALQWWGILIEVFLLAGMIFGVIKFFANRVEKRERMRTAFQLQLSNAEQKALRAQMNPHFIFNALNTVQLFIIENDKKQAYEYLEKFGVLIRKTLEFSREKSIRLQEEIDLLQLYLELESKRFEGKFDFRIQVAETVEVSMLRIPPMLIQPYVENAIRHGIMHKAGKGNIWVKVNSGDGHLKIVVEDDGVGRVVSAKMNAYRSTHKSLGTGITQERIMLLNQMGAGEFSVKIIDLKEDDGNSCGTQVELNIPLNREF